MTHEAFGMRVLKIRGKRANLLLLVQGRSRGLILRRVFRDRAATIRAKARVNHPKMRDTSGLLASQGREHVPPAWTLKAGLSSKTGILEL